MNWIEKILALDPCTDAVDWCNTQPDYETAWRTCKRGDWMIWWLQKSLTPVKHHTWVQIACGSARLVLWYVPTGEDAPYNAVVTAEAWLRGEATQDECRAAAAARAAYAAVWTTNATWAAARAADAAAYAATDASCAAVWTARAARATWAAAYAAVWAAVWTARAAADATRAAHAAHAAFRAARAVAETDREWVLAEIADIVRKYVPEPSKWRNK